MNPIRQAITSVKNQRIKDVLSLAKGRKRKSAGSFGVEGEREITRAFLSGYVPDQIFVCPELLSKDFARTVALAEKTHQCPVFEVTRDVFEKLAMREDSGGAFAVLLDRNLQLKQLKLPQKPLIIAVQGIEKPGNLGALLRSADGSGADAIVVLDTVIDIYNPNVIRSSLGTIFSKQVCCASSEEFLQFCQEGRITTVGAALKDRTVSYDRHDYKESSAVILGTEATGLTDFWLEHCQVLVKIPMLGIADSLNVAMAGAIILYEARRQRLK